MAHDPSTGACVEITSSIVPTALCVLGSHPRRRHWRLQAGHSDVHHFLQTWLRSGISFAKGGSKASYDSPLYTVRGESKVERVAERLFYVFKKTIGWRRGDKLDYNGFGPLADARAYVLYSPPHQRFGARSNTVVLS